MQSYSEMTQVLYELVLEIGGSAELRPMLNRALQAMLRKLNCMGGLVLRRATEEGAEPYREMLVMPRNLKGKPAYQKALGSLSAAAVAEEAPQLQQSPVPVDCGGMVFYSYALPGYGVLILFKSRPFEGVVAESLSQVCEKLAEACLACEMATHLLRSREDLRVTLDSIGDAVLATDLQGCIVRMNPVAEKLAGWSFSEAVGHKVTDVLQLSRPDTGQPMNAQVHTVLAEQVVRESSFDSVLTSRQGEAYRVAGSTARIEDGAGHAIGAVCVMRDVTDEVRLQEQLMQSRKMEAIGQLAGGVAHDFNNQLAGILGFADMLANRLKDPKYIGYADSIRQAAERSAELTNQLLAFGRKGKFLSVSVDLHRCISEVVAMLDRSIDKNIHLEQHLLAHSSMIKGDPGQVHNALLNLGLNARDAMPEGGTLVFRTGSLELAPGNDLLEQHDLKAGSYLLVVVRDSGVGMSPEVRQHIFEPFFTTKDVGEGTGLGLASVYGTVKSHGGAIDVESVLGEGTVFSLLFPVLEDAPAPARNRRRDAIPGHARVLIVDDEPIVRRVGQTLLSELGCSVVTCSNGQEALTHYREHWQEIDLVILDMIMPVMGGLETFEKMKAINPEIRALLSTGYSLNEEAQQIMQAGVMAFVAKPFTEAELSRTVAQVLQGELG